MRRHLKNFARGALAKLGFQIRSLRLARLHEVLDAALVEWTRLDFGLDGAAPFTALGIVFSKDRALQLHALLESWFAQVEGSARMVVLWTASNQDHENAYRELMVLWSGKVEWVREMSFRDDLLAIVASDRSTHLFFLTDDALVLRTFLLADVLLPDPRRRIFSLCHCPDLVWCFVARRAQKVPPLRSLGKNLLGWNWTDGEPGTDWAFPLSVDGKFFARREICLLLAHLPFRSPNTLEESLQIFQPLFVGREGLCFEAAALANIPCNTVQTQFDNPDTGAFTTAELLAHWWRGERIVWEDFKSMKPGQAEVSRYGFAPRPR